MIYVSVKDIVVKHVVTPIINVVPGRGADTRRDFEKSQHLAFVNFQFVPR